LIFGTLSHKVIGFQRPRFSSYFLKTFSLKSQFAFLGQAINVASSDLLVVLAGLSKSQVSVGYSL
jgi:hypothetical protein